MHMQNSTIYNPQLRKKMTQSSFTLSDADDNIASHPKKRHVYFSPFINHDIVDTLNGNETNHSSLHTNQSIHSKTVMIVLNRPISCPPSAIFHKLWSISSFHICADGGANRLYDATVQSKDLVVYIPDMIQGDLDSVRVDTRSFYTSQGVRIQRDASQESHDLDKAIQSILILLEEESRDASSCRVYVYGAFGGRFDHEMAAFNALYRWGSIFNHQIYLYDDETCAFLLPTGICNEIHIMNYGDDSTLYQTGEGPHCGIIPLGEACSWISTHGFKWDLDGDRSTSFGSLVSTSNKVMKSIVTIESSNPVVFTAEMKVTDSK